jgi:MFS family permease
MKITDRNVFFVILEGIAAAIVLNLFNPFTQMFAKRMGAGDIHIALINSLPPLVAILVLIPCGFLIEKISNKKLVTCILLGFSSMFYAAIAFSPNLSHETRVIVYVILMGLMNWPGALYTTTWQAFFSYTFKDRDADYIYTQRSKYGAFFGLLTVLITGLLLSYIPKSDEQRIFIYQLFYAACFLITIVQIIFLTKVRRGSNEDQKVSVTNTPNLALKDIKDIFKNKPFMIFCACTFLFYVTWQMGWPLFFIYNSDYIKVNEFQLGLINVASGLASFLSFSFWNKLAEKKGNSFVIMLGALGLALNPFFYTSNISLHWIVIINTIVGAACAGLLLGLFCNLLEILPENNKTIYISIYNTFINISGFISPLIGVWINRHAGIYHSMLLIGILRTLGACLFVLRWYMIEKNKKFDIKALYT